MHEPAVPERPGIDQRMVPSRLSVCSKPPLDPGNELCLVDDVPSDRRDRSAVGESRVQLRESREADLHEEFVPWVIAEHDRIFARAHECAQPAGEFMIRHCTRPAIEQGNYAATHENRVSLRQRIALKVQLAGTVLTHQREADKLGFQEVLVRELSIEEQVHLTF
ncbi:MAG: hypothetical protein ACYCYH_13035 [Steroidobacteraceae bacterium]